MSSGGKNQDSPVPVWQVACGGMISVFSGSNDASPAAQGKEINTGGFYFGLYWEFSVDREDH